MHQSINESTKSLPEISFDVEGENHLHVTILTDRLRMESVLVRNQQDYIDLFSDQEVMRMYADGICWTESKVTLRMNEWIDRWERSIPYSALAISHSLEDVFIGHIVLGYGDSPGISELAYAIKSDQQRKGYGSEAVCCIAGDYVSELVKRNYKCENETLKAVTATCKEDNIASKKILEKAGMRIINKTGRYGSIRFQFWKDVSQLGEAKDKSAITLDTIQLDIRQPLASMSTMYAKL